MCDSFHNSLLHGTENIFSRNEKLIDSNKAGANKSHMTTNASTDATVSDEHDIESSIGLLPIATLGLSSDVTSLLTLVLCDSASTQYCQSGSPLTCHLVVSFQPPKIHN